MSQNDINKQIEDLRKEVISLRTETTRKLSALESDIASQKRKTHALDNTLKGIKKDLDKVVPYINNLMHKADNIIKKNYTALLQRHTIMNQRVIEMASQISSLLQRK